MRVPRCCVRDDAVGCLLVVCAMMLWGCVSPHLLPLWFLMRSCLPYALSLCVCNTLCFGSGKMCTCNPSSTLGWCSRGRTRGAGLCPCPALRWVSRIMQQCLACVPVMYLQCVCRSPVPMPVRHVAQATVAAPGSGHRERACEVRAALAVITHDVYGVTCGCVGLSDVCWGAHPVVHLVSLVLDPHLLRVVDTERARRR